MRPDMEECRFSSPLTEDELEAALDGVADSSIEQHLQACPYCAARLAEIERFENALTGALYRWDCPSTQELGEYHLRLLSDERQTAITDHLKACLRCRDEFAEIRRFV